MRSRDVVFYENQSFVDIDKVKKFKDLISGSFDLT